MPSVTLHNWESMPKEAVTDVIERRLVTSERSMLGERKGED